MKLKYFRESVPQGGISDELPFAYSEKIKPIVLENTVLKPDFHNFDLCFTQTIDSCIDDETEIEHWDGMKITGKESLLYLSITPSVFTHGERIEKYITSEENCEVPKIIDMFMKEEGFKEMMTKAKKHIVTYGREAWSLPNGLGLILNREGNFYEGCFNDLQSAFLNKYFQVRGRFIANDQLKGIDYHLNWERYNELIR